MTDHVCGRHWSGALTCHCSVCHETFVGVRDFDKHRLRGTCEYPTRLAMRPADREYPCWTSTPEIPAEKEMGK